MTDTHRLFRLMYRSRLAVAPGSRREEIASIVEVSRRNTDLAITGALLIWQDCVVQTLEGQEGAVLDLYDKIARDDRHDTVTVLEAQHLETRLFSRWSTVRPCPPSRAARVPSP